MIIRVLLLFAIFTIFFLSFRFPKKLGWAYITLLPLGCGIPSLVLIPDPILFLNFDRVGIIVAIGILLRFKNTIKYLNLLSESFFLCFTIFVILLSVAALRDYGFLHVVVNKIFFLVSPVIIGYSIVSNREDMKRLLTIYALASAIIGGLCILEYFLRFNLASFLIMNVNTQKVLERTMPSLTELYRTGFYRVQGFDGNAIFTNMKLAFLFPITLWYSIETKLVGKACVFLTLAGLIVLQTKTGIIGIGLSFIPVLLFFRQKTNFKILFSLCLGIVAMSFCSFEIIAIAKRFFVDELLYYLDLFISTGIQDSQRSWSIPFSIEKIVENPLFGYGSTAYVYYDILYTADCPSVLLYSLSGGIFLGGAFLILLTIMIYKPYSIALRKKLHMTDKKILVFCTSAFIAGIVPLFTTFNEKYYPILVLLFSAIYRTYRYPRICPQQKNETINGCDTKIPQYME